MTYRTANTDPTREFLNSVRYARVEYSRLSERIKALESRCTSITASMSAMPNGGSADAQALWAALADESAKLYPELRRAQEAEREVNEFIDALPNPAHRLVLKLRYVDVRGWEDVIQHLTQGGLAYSARQVYRIHGEALEVARALWSETHKEDNNDE